MKRREFLKAGVVGGLGATIAGCATPAAPAPVATEASGETPAPSSQEPTATTGTPAGSQTQDMPELQWDMATSWPVALDTIFGGATDVANRVAELTDGRFVITPRAGGEIAKATEVLDVVQSGAVPIGHTASYYYVGKSPIFAFGTALPFGLSAQQQNAWLYDGGGLELLQEIYQRQFGVIQFPAGNTGVQMGGWWRKEINTPEDLQGLRMRIPGLGGQVMTKLGVTVQTIPGGEIFQSLQTGAVDAAEWVGPYDDLKLGLNDVADFYYYPGWWEPGSSLEIQINLNEWNALPPFYQNCLKVAAAEANINMLSRYDARNQAALTEIVNGGTTLAKFPDEVLAAASAAADELYAEFAESNADFAAIFEQWSAFRDQVRQWSNIAEYSYYGFVIPNSAAG